jgi:uncharacterized protein Usg
MKNIKLQLEGYCLTTAEILYHLPDHPHLLQSRRPPLALIIRS